MTTLKRLKLNLFVKSPLVAVLFQLSDSSAGHRPSFRNLILLIQLCSWQQITNPQDNVGRASGIHAGKTWPSRVFVRPQPVSSGRALLRVCRATTHLGWSLAKAYVLSTLRLGRYS